MKNPVLNLFYAILTGVIAFAQPPVAKPDPAPPAKAWVFEVATIKPAAPMNPAAFASGKLHVGMTVNGNRVDIGFLSLNELIPLAYRVKAYQVSGPSWMKDQRFDILGEMPPGATREQVPDLLQTLLADRFKLTFHRESKEHSFYALVVNKKGLKLKEAEPEQAPAKTETAENAPSGDGNPPTKPEDRPLSIKNDSKGVVISGGGQKGSMRITRGADGMRFESDRSTMAILADTLSRFVDRPVIDMTELKGEYQIALEVSMQDLLAMARAAGAPVPPGAGGGAAGGDSKAPLDGASDPGGHSIMDSVEKLGLKLEPRKGPIEVIVVDHVEKMPTEN